MWSRLRATGYEQKMQYRQSIWGYGYQTVTIPHGLAVYCRREYGVECVVGQPEVNYRETITKKVQFNYLHKKQTGGSGQYARVMGFVEPLPADARDKNNEVLHFEFQNRVLGASIPPEFITSVEKGEDRCYHMLHMIPLLHLSANLRHTC